ncbi:MAG: hypothetical protein M3159_06705 [Actinomycetota bacterium]|nr:hypothetical protein [Actinomycetota bacterium]
MVDEWDEGVVTVSLAGASTDTDVAGALALAFGVLDSGTRPLPESIVKALGVRHFP